MTKYGIYDKEMDMWVKHNYKEHLGDGIVLTEDVREAFVGEREEVSRAWETIKYSLRGRNHTFDEFEFRIPLIKADFGPNAGLNYKDNLFDEA